MIPDLAPLLAMNMTEIALWGAGGLIVVMLGLMMVYSIFRAFYQKVDQGFALINNTMSQTPKVTFTGMLVIPIIHRTEVMDISVKTIQVDRRGKDGLICSDNVRADITVAFYVRVNKTAEDVLQVASAVGVKRASAGSRSASKATPFATTTLPGALGSTAGPVLIKTIASMLRASR